jgi:hypothetical protein
MFAQVIQARTSDPEAVLAHVDRWMQELQPGSIGWLGSTVGVDDDGRLVAVVRFESADEAQRNADRPEQTRWWEAMLPHLDGEPTVRDSEQVTLDLVDDPDRAGFVQVMQGQVTDPERAQELMAQFPQDAMKEFRPDVLGTVMINHDEGRWTQVIYFTSESEARQGERKEAPPEFQAVMEQLMNISVGEPEFIDLRRPMLLAPR